MAQKTVSIGSAIDIHAFDDGDTEYGVETDAKIKVGTAPTVNDETVRLQDIVAPGTGISSGAVIADHAIVRGDGGARVVQDSGVTIDDADNIALPALSTVDGVDISVHAANVDAHHNEGHDIDSHDDAPLGGLANDDLMQFNDPGSVWEAKSIQEIIDGQTITPGDVIVNNKIRLTPLGGVAVALTNKTGANSVAGQLVVADTANDDAVILTGVDDHNCIGVFLDSGIADGAEAWVVTDGIADVAMEDNTAATHGNWVYASAEAGYADSTLVAPPLGGIAQLDTHMQEVGHCLESVAATGGGTHILARCALHFN